MADRCEKCDYFKLNSQADNGGKGVGECRKGTPKSGKRFPQVKREDWCGEFYTEPEPIPPEPEIDPTTFCVACDNYQPEVTAEIKQDHKLNSEFHVCKTKNINYVIGGEIDPSYTMCVDRNSSGTCSYYIAKGTE